MTDHELITEAWRAAADDPDLTLSPCSSDRFFDAMEAALRKARAQMSSEEITRLIDDRIGRLIVCLAAREEDVELFRGVVRGDRDATLEYSYGLEAEGKPAQARRVRDLLPES